MYVLANAPARALRLAVLVPGTGGSGSRLLGIGMQFLMDKMDHNTYNQPRQHTGQRGKHP